MAAWSSQKPRGSTWRWRKPIGYARWRPKLTQELQAAYNMHEDMKIEVITEYNKMKKDEEARRNVLSSELQAVQDELARIMVEMEASNLASETAQQGLHRSANPKAQP
mgnify:CR=1 FL=1